MKLLAQIPLVAEICEHVDEGNPTTAALVADSMTGQNPDNPEALAFGELADSIVKACEERNVQLPPTEKVNVASNQK